MHSLLFVKQLNGLLFNLAVATAFIVFVPVVGLLMYAALASTLQTFFVGVIAPVMCTITVAVWVSTREVRLLVPRVHLLAHPELCKGPWSLRGPRGDGNGDRSLAWPSCTQYISRFLLSLV